MTSHNARQHRFLSKTIIESYGEHSGPAQEVLAHFIAWAKRLSVTEDRNGIGNKMFWRSVAGEEENTERRQFSRMVARLETQLKWFGQPSRMHKMQHESLHATLGTLIDALDRYHDVFAQELAAFRSAVAAMPHKDEAEITHQDREVTDCCKFYEGATIKTHLESLNLRAFRQSLKERLRPGLYTGRS